ncbi:MAG: hypothetical protein PHH00_04055, partial [Candidatus Nanoarchaeia archaeon]|nr:hypothetical protein [Candidatus Nanoarchaeia archaeon]
MKPGEMILGIDINKIINNYFPILRDKKIFVEEKDAPYRAHVSYSLFGKMKIIVSSKLRKLPKYVVRRILIHELCHLEIFVRQGVIRTNIQYLGYLLSEKIRNNAERAANILMIKKGFGKLILDARKENIKRELGYSLTEKEIKYYI